MRKEKLNNLGMIHLGNAFLKALSLKPHDYVNVYSKENKIVIERYIPKCKICNNEDLIEGFEICTKCAKEIYIKYKEVIKNEKNS